MAMKNYMLLIFIIISTLHINSLSSCPCGFSPDDKRPFFEQYETKINAPTPQEKEEKS